MTQITTLIQEHYSGWERSDWEAGSCTFCGKFIDLQPITPAQYELIKKQVSPPTVIRHCGERTCKQQFGSNVMALSRWIALFDGQD